MVSEVHSNDQSMNRQESFGLLFTRPISLQFPEGGHFGFGHDASNVALLRAQTTPDTVWKDSELANNSSLEPLLEKIDVRLNMLSTILNDLLRATASIPDEHELWLTDRSLYLNQFGGIENRIGSNCEVALFLFPEIPMPLKLLGYIQFADEDHEFKYEIDFSNNNIETTELLGKFLFQTHRRQIATMRASKLEGEIE